MEFRERHRKLIRDLANLTGKDWDARIEQALLDAERSGIEKAAAYLFSNGDPDDWKAREKYAAEIRKLMENPNA